MTTILLIFEGERIEPGILKKLETSFFSNENTKKRISVCFKTDIFEFYDALKDEDGFLNPLGVLQERDPETCKEIESSEEIAAIYLFFDHDIHADKGMTYEEKNLKIDELLTFFDNETENGLLLISYPMVEAYKDWDDKGQDCSSCLANIMENTKYKSLVQERHPGHDQRDFFSFDNWVLLMQITLSRAMYLVRGNQDDTKFENMQETVQQHLIFEAQNKKFVIPHFQVVILSSIPFFLFLELGPSFFNKHIKDFLQQLQCKHRCIIAGIPLTELTIK